MIKRLLKLIRRKQCEHLRVYETMACDAICRDCGQNLGFIQNWRDANKGKAGASEIGNDPSSARSWGTTDHPAAGQEP